MRKSKNTEGRHAARVGLLLAALLFALPRLAGDSALTITGARESEGYIAMTENALAQSGVRLFKTDSGYDIPGGQTYALPAAVITEPPLIVITGTP